MLTPQPQRHSAQAEIQTGSSDVRELRLDSRLRGNDIGDGENEPQDYREESTASTSARVGGLAPTRLQLMPAATAPNQSMSLSAA
jgi:hypothetical protein